MVSGSVAGSLVTEMPTLAGHRDFGGRERDGLFDGLDDAHPERHRFGFGLQVHGQDHELVAAETGDRVAVAHQLRETAGDRHQQFVADLVAEGVVDGLELVEVDEQHRDDAFAAVQTRDRLLGAVEQQQPVGELGERVVDGLAGFSSCMRSVTSLAAAYQVSPSRLALHSSQRHSPSRWR